MFLNNRWNVLQIFGGEGAAASGSSGGEGSIAGSTEAGEGCVDAGHKRLLELGVPESKIRKPREKKVSPLPEGAIRTKQNAEVPAQQPPAAESTNAQAENIPARMSWEEIVKDPEYNAEIQKIVKTRLKEDSKRKSILEVLDPALKHLAREHGLDPENLDHTALAKAITGEYEDKALEMGVSKETAMKLDQQQRTLEQQKFQNHILKLQQQEQAMKAVIPNFDLRREMQNPTFARMTSVGLSVEDAFYAVHRREMQAQSMQVAAQQAQQMISNAIASGSRRPDESGTASQAPSVSKFDYRKATPAQRKALKEEIRRAAAEGRKIYPG